MTTLESIFQGGIRVNLTPKMRQSLLNVTPRSQMMPNFTFPLHKYDSKEIKPATSAFTTCADTCEGKRSHATTPRIFKIRAEHLRRGVHRFHPGQYRFAYCFSLLLLLTATELAEICVAENSVAAWLCVSFDAKLRML